MLDTLARCLTRPFRALANSYECFVPIAFLLSAIILGATTWFVLIAEILDVEQPWTPTSCTIAGEVAFETVRRKGPDGIRVALPVTFSEPGSPGPPKWSAVANRWPLKLMADAKMSVVYEWWTQDFGGGGKVLEPPAEGWFGGEGKFQFITPVGKIVACWFKPTSDGSVPTRVKLSSEAVATWGYWIGVAVLVPFIIVFIGGAVWFMSSACEQYQDSYEELADDDQEAAEEAAERARRPALTRVNSRAGKLVGARTINRSNSHFDLNPSNYYQGSHELSIRLGFVRKVYGIVGAQMLVTVMVSLLFMYYPPMAEWVQSPCIMINIDGPRIFCSAWLTYSVYGAMLISLFGCYMYKNEYPTNMLMLLAFTLSTSIVVGVTCSIYRTQGYEDVILQALIMTAVLFVGLTVFTMVTKVDFTFMAMGLFCALLLLPVASILAFVMQSAILYTIYAYAGALTFCLYIVFDTYMITQRLGYDDYIPAAIELYLDILNLFLYLLRLFGSSRN